MIIVMEMMASKLPLMFLLTIGVLPVKGYICNNDTSLPKDDFEYHGCFCGTNRTANEHFHLFSTYMEAFAGCHEPGGDVTIECAFLKGSEAEILKNLFNRTSLSEIPVIDEDQGRVYENVTCLLLSGNSISSITRQQMRQFPKLKRIYLNNNGRIRIDSDAFASNPKLINISLGNNDLTEYPDLSSAKNLENVDLSGNIMLGPNIPGNIIDKLIIINLKGAGLTEFPNITGAIRLRDL